MKRMIEIFKLRSRSTVWKYYAFTFLRNFAFFSAVLVPFFTDWGGISLVQVQFLQSWFMFWIFILEIPTGAVADYMGRKYSMALGAFCMTIAVMVYSLFPNFWFFLFAEFIFSAAVALMSGADKALLYDALKEAGEEEESKKIFGRSHAAGLLGILISAPLGGFIATTWGLNAPMLLTAIPFFLAGLIAWSIKEPKIKDKISERKRYLDIAVKGTIFFYKHKVLRMLAIDSVIVASTAYFVIWLYQPLLTSIKVPIIYFGFAHAFLVAVEIVVSSNFVRLEKLFGSGKAYLRFSAVATSVGFILVAIFPNLITAGLFLILAGGFGLTRQELMISYMNKFISSEQRATVLSSISMFRQLALVLLNPAVGFAADRSLGIALFAVGLLPLLLFLFSPIEQEMLEDKSS